jgi:hydroxymethylpyrimidine pyrophosphatase-like HAD family hydrolase
MLTAVKYGIAMANGTENCKKAACFVTDTNENDGVVKGILKLGIYSLEK